MSVVKSFLLGLGGAAVVASGVAGTASTASAHTVAAGVGACEFYAREYAAVNTPHFGDWNTAYRFAYNECLTGGPDFVVGGPYTYGRGPLSAGAHVAGSALHAGASVAGSALNAGASLAGAALSIPGAILGGTASALAPQAAPVRPRISRTAAPVVTKNYRGTYETPVVANVALESTAALAVPMATSEQFSPEWIAYCDAKYNSFNPQTGMYLAYSGTYRMCN
ncbi:MAG TPA: BA14K family protein [Aestuariivirgaceae bacterium]|nr:BA14K family protein [Aestuariivirgaceae bacterium]